MKTGGNPENIIVIGGSAGSIQVLSKMLCTLPSNSDRAIIICLHRMKTIASGMKEVFSCHCPLHIVEPDDKQPILGNTIYLAPANYHLLIEQDRCFSLSTEMPVNFSRPSIDVTFESAARVFKNSLTGILLTGANSDGAAGLHAIYMNNGTTIVQKPEECAAPYMPLSAIERNCVNHILSVKEIASFLNRPFSS